MILSRQKSPVYTLGPKERDKWKRETEKKEKTKVEEIF